MKQIPEQNLCGALVIDKPSGITSAEVLRRIKKKFSPSRLGHTGTLDPLATGLLIALFGPATRIQDYLMAQEKEYEGEITLGLQTTTDDISGDIINQTSLSEPLSILELQNLASVFSGSYLQHPPQFSACKTEGKRAYALARQGKHVALEPRLVRVYNLSLAQSDISSLSYRVSCSSGFYVRALARDLGSKIGCGACIKTIRRTRSGGFRVEDAYSLEQILNLSSIHEAIVPLRKLTCSLPQVTIDKQSVLLLRAGDQRVLTRVGLPPVPSSGSGLAIVLDDSEQVVALLEPSLPKETSPGDSTPFWKLRAVLNG